MSPSFFQPVDLRLLDVELIDPSRPRLTEIFGRKHNTRPGWLTIGNQIGGDMVWEPELAERLKQKYPERVNLAPIS